MDKKEILKDFEDVKKEILAIVLFGSVAFGEDTERSDVDICLVVGDRKRITRVWDWILRSGVTEKYDVKIFELLPLKLKKAVMDGKILWTSDEDRLWMIFWKYKKIWEDEILAKRKLGLRIFG
jgi:predicted nucleotidyltransferase